MSLKDLFKKYSLNDRIYLQFNEKTRQYEFFQFGELIPYKKLDKYAKEFLDSHNNDLKNNPELVEKELAKIEYERKVDEREKKLEDMGYTCSSTMFISDLPISPINSEFSQKLDNMLSEENVLYGIHRVGDTSDKGIMDILENGLEMTGHGWFVDQSALELNQNVGYYPDNMQIKSELICAHGYKGSKGSLLIRIPDEDLKTGDIFITEEKKFKRLNPKYIVGYVPIIMKQNGTVTIDKILTLKDFKQIKEPEIKENKQTTVNNQLYNDLAIDENLTQEHGKSL